MKKLPIGEGPMVAVAIGVSFRKHSQHSPIKLLETDTANLPGKTLPVQMEVAGALVRDHANAVNVVWHEGDAQRDAVSDAQPRAPPPTFDDNDALHLF